MPIATGPAPVGWNPQAAITTRHPEIAEFGRAVQPEIRAIEAKLDRVEAAGGDAFSPRQVLRELRWRLEYTDDLAGIRAVTVSLRTLASASQDEDEAHRQGGVWFLQLDACVDHVLDDDFANQGTAPRLLDRVNEPGRLKEYLESLLVSRPEEDGIDRRKELNLATANLVRLILWRRPRGYPWDPRLEPVMRRFIAEWQDPATGFFGADYLIGGRRLRTADLSLTFHMARYLEGAIGYWPQLIDTLLSIRDHRYPNGWLDEPQQLRRRSPVAARLAAHAARSAPACRAGARRAPRLVPEDGDFRGRRNRGAGAR
jgi:hypothetical protein